MSAERIAELEAEVARLTLCISDVTNALQPFADEGRKAREIHIYPHPERVRAIGDCTYADLYRAADTLPEAPK